MVAVVVSVGAGEILHMLALEMMMSCVLVLCDLGLICFFRYVLRKLP